MHPSEQRARAQSIEEWLAENATGIPVLPKNLNDNSGFQGEVNLVYNHHRTTKDGRLVMAFLNVLTEQEVVYFCNVDVRRQRGNLKGKSYPTGMNGQFLPPVRGKFRKFWMLATGEQRDRWANVHKEMKSKLGGIVFSGEVSVGFKKDGTAFNRIDNLRLIEKQFENSIGTAVEQDGNNGQEQQIAATARAY
jgi:hypothetical protein